MSFAETSNAYYFLMPDKNHYPKCNFWIQQILKFIFSWREQGGRKFSKILCRVGLNLIDPQSIFSSD